MKNMTRIAAAIVVAALGMTLLAGRVAAQETEQQREARMAWWREAKFGMFIHWGPVSLTGQEISWSRKGGRGWIGAADSGTPAEIYDNLYKEFNPVEFDAKEWVAIAKAAGMKYMVLTTKHHDGFCMFDTKTTDYKITSPDSPFKRDITAELAKACHEAGMHFGVYYSQPDWHHPDFYTARHAEYRKYMYTHLEELCSNYGKIDVVWFDGLGAGADQWEPEKLIPIIRKLQPQVIINNRCGWGEDFDTPEQEIGRYQFGRAWESCITLCGPWAWAPNGFLRPLGECIGTLVMCAGGDGNLLLNVGPMPSGRIEPRQVQRLKDMGAWIDKYGKSIYGTRGGPFQFAGGCSTHVDNTIYVHIMSWLNDPLVLPALKHKIVSSTVLTGGKAEVEQTEKTTEISVDRRNLIDTIVALELDGPARDSLAR